MWLAKLQRMIDELPEQYLQAQPADLQVLMLIEPGSKPVSQLTEEEKKLDGVLRQLWAAALLEAEAHRALYGEDESKHPPEACRKHNLEMRPRDKEMQIISAILLMSLEERLGFESEYVIDGHDVYAIPHISVDVIFQEPGDDQPMPDDFVDIPGFKGWPEKES